MKHVLIEELSETCAYRGTVRNRRSSSQGHMGEGKGGEVEKDAYVAIDLALWPPPTAYFDFDFDVDFDVDFDYDFDFRT